MADPYAPTDDWQEGYDAGYYSGFQAGVAKGSPPRSLRNAEAFKQPSKRKVPQKGKAKVLTDMTAPVWAKYKKGRGKKTYVTIRGEVSRSLKYRKKVKGMK